MPMTTKASVHETALASAPRPTGTPAATTRMAVFWIPIALPACRLPEISAAAVNERPFQLIAATPPAISAGGPSTAPARSSTPARSASRRNGSMRSP